MKKRNTYYNIDCEFKEDGTSLDSIIKDNFIIFLMEIYNK